MMEARRNILKSFCDSDSSEVELCPKISADTMTSRRSRRLYTNRQRQLLTEAYESCRHLNRDTRVRLARKLDLQEDDVMTWFRNSRRRERRLEKNSDLCPESPGYLPPLYTRPSTNQPSTPITKNHHEAFSGATSPDSVLFGRYQAYSNCSSPLSSGSHKSPPTTSPQQGNRQPSPHQCEPYSNIIAPWVYNGRKEISPIHLTNSKSCAEVVEQWLAMCPTPEKSPDYKITLSSKPDGSTSIPSMAVTPARGNSSTSTVLSPDFGSCGSSWSSMSSLHFRYPVPDQSASPVLPSPSQSLKQAVTPAHGNSSTSTVLSPDFGSCGSSWSSMSSLHFRYPVPDQSASPVLSSPAQSLKQIQTDITQQKDLKPSAFTPLGKLHPIKDQNKIEAYFTPIRNQDNKKVTSFQPIGQKNQLGPLFSAMIDVLIPQVLHSTPKDVEASCLRLMSIV